MDWLGILAAAAGLQLGSACVMFMTRTLWVMGSILIWCMQRYEATCVHTASAGQMPIMFGNEEGGCGPSSQHRVVDV